MLNDIDNLTPELERLVGILGQVINGRNLLNLIMIIILSQYSYLYANRKFSSKAIYDYH